MVFKLEKHYQQECKSFWEENQYQATISEKTFWKRIREGNDLCEAILYKFKTALKAFYEIHADENSVSYLQYQRKVNESGLGEEHWHQFLSSKASKLSPEVVDFWEKNKNKAEIIYATYLRRYRNGQALNQLILINEDKHDPIGKFYNDQKDPQVTLASFRKRVNKLSLEDQGNPEKLLECIQTKHNIYRYYHANIGRMFISYALFYERSRKNPHLELCQIDTMPSTNIINKIIPGAKEFYLAHQKESDCTYESFLIRLRKDKSLTFRKALINSRNYKRQFHAKYKKTNIPFSTFLRRIVNNINGVSWFVLLDRNYRTMSECKTFYDKNKKLNKEDMSFTQFHLLATHIYLDKSLEEIIGLKRLKPIAKAFYEENVPQEGEVVSKSTYITRAYKNKEKNLEEIEFSRLASYIHIELIHIYKNETINGRNPQNVSMGAYLARLRANPSITPIEALEMPYEYIPRNKIDAYAGSGCHNGKSKGFISQEVDIREEKMDIRINKIPGYNFTEKQKKVLYDYLSGKSGNLDHKSFY